MSPQRTAIRRIRAGRRKDTLNAQSPVAPANRSDVLKLEALLSGSELALRDTVRAFVDERIRPNIAAWYEDAHFPVEIAQEMGALGLLGMHLEGYGCPGRSA